MPERLETAEAAWVAQTEDRLRQLEQENDRLRQQNDRLSLQLRHLTEPYVTSCFGHGYIKTIRFATSYPLAPRDRPIISCSNVDFDPDFEEESSLLPGVWYCNWDNDALPGFVADWFPNTLRKRKTIDMAHVMLYHGDSSSAALTLIDAPHRSQVMRDWLQALDAHWHPSLVDVYWASDAEMSAVGLLSEEHYSMRDDQLTAGEVETLRQVLVIMQQRRLEQLPVPWIFELALDNVGVRSIVGLGGGS